MIVTRTTAGKIVTIVYATIGIPLYLVVMSDLGGFLKSCIQMIMSIVKKVSQQILGRAEKSEDWSKILKFGDYDFVPLPIWFAVLLLYLYMLVSAGIFMIFEPHWDYMNAFWFSFCTFSTIGFGDDFPKNPNYMYASFAFLVIGMSMVTMCLTAIKDYMQRRYAQAAAKRRFAQNFIAKWGNMAAQTKTN